ncbi:MAG: tripartite tricarboxylate transporter permease [Acetobacteraceae bacterium]|nr:tripartite tricarboxylate transporter permease [Acetobacteraceae bacterium]
MLDAAYHALLLILEPMRLAIMFGGVLLGLALGVIPGLGGIVGLALLIPFTYHMDAPSAFALLLGMASVTTVSDFIPAVLFGVPGTVGAAATVLDGYPMAQQGKAARAFGAGYAASLAGGIFGALVLGLAIPILRPLVLYLGSAELLAFCIFGLSMVAVLSGKAPMRGLTAAALGLMLSMVGSDPETGTQRWTFDTLYLWDHLPLVPATLGLFAVPELAEMAVRRNFLKGDAKALMSQATQWDGVRDALTSWKLILRCSGLGALLGAIPGIGSAVIDWIAYGHALQTEKNTEGFGHGDVRGVIAAESSNNAKEGGHLVPTIAFGVPAGASMALLLSAFLLHGFQPGPEMLTKHLDVTYSIVWTLTLSHIMGALICLAASGLFAKLALIRVGLLVPSVLAIILLGAFNGSQSWGDLYSVAIFGGLGWAMKQLNWPRPPLILGLVLGSMFERYLFITQQLFGWSALSRPVVAVVLLGAAYVVLRPVVLSTRRIFNNRQALAMGWIAPRWSWNAGFAALLLAIVVHALVISTDWPDHAQIVPQAAGFAALLFGFGVLITEAFGQRRNPMALAKKIGLAVGHAPQAAPGEGPAKAHTKQERARAWRFFLWLAAALIAATLIGLLPGLALAIFCLAWREFGEPAKRAGLLALGMSLFFWLVFDRIFSTPWPDSVLGDAWPWLRAVSGLV